MIAMSFGPNRQTKWIALGILAFGALSGCGKGLNFGNSSGETRVEYYMVDGVKNIRADIQEGTDPRSMREDQYAISTSSRLLLRFESLTAQSSRVIISDSDDVWIRVVLGQGQALEQAQAQLKLCPLTKNWMMLATWRFAHPFGPSGLWSAEGGDFELSSCVVGMSDPGKTVDVGVTPLDQRALYFKITRWFQDLNRGKGENRGHVMISESGEFFILGDNSESYGPRIQWSEMAF